ncbi:MAG: chemotaxis protein methyltransferase CheR [Steroidobacteraceae bacterium]|nr:chemotaxis protein methyltransferase CheR [Steroidobacteraceae bacterium]
MAMPLTALDREIAQLRERLEGAEEMRRAVCTEPLDGVVIDDVEPRPVALLNGASVTRSSTPNDSSPPPAVTVSDTGAILHANQRFAVFTGRTLRELYSLPVAELLVESDRPRVAILLESGRRDTTLEVSLLRPDGTQRPVRLATIDVAHGSTSFLVVDVEEESRRAAAESTLVALSTGDIDAVVIGGEQVILVAEADRSYRNLVDRIGQGAVSLTRHGEVLYANEPVAVMLGLRREELLGRNFLDLVEEGESRLRSFLDDATASPGSLEVSLRRNGGESLPVAVSAETGPGRDVAATLVLTDLTEHRRHVKIQEETRRKDEFLAVLAHELRNPLASIRTCVQILDRSGGLDGPEQQAVRIINRQSTTLVRLVDDLLDIHRLNQGKIVMRREPVPLREIVNDAIDAARPYLSARRLRLDVALPDQDVHVEADKVRLTQVLLNLLSNASKFTPREGLVRVLVERLTAAGRRESVRVTVTDTGCGIEPSQLESIFEPYVQLGAAGETPATGLGLGLSVARRLVELHGGTIRAESDGAGRGSQFVLELPTCAAAVADVDAATTTVQAETSDRVRVLIVDDNRDAAESLAMLVRLSGHDVRTVHDGNEALAVGETFGPDIVFLDIGMPVLDGYATARSWRASRWGHGSKLYALTGYGQGEDRQRRSREAGFDGHFVKPIDPDHVLKLLQQAADTMRRPVAFASPSNADRTG